MISSAPDREQETQLVETVELIFGAGGGAAYNALREHRGNILDALKAQGQANTFVLRAWRLAEPDDWPLWREQVTKGAKPGDGEAAAALALLPRFFEGWNALSDPQAEELSDLVEAVVACAGLIGEKDVDESVLTAIESSLTSPDWPTDTSARRRRERLHAAARKLGHLGAAMWQRVEALLTNDVVSGMEWAQAGHPGVTGESVWEALRGIETMVSALGDGPIKHLVGRLPQFDPDVQPEEAAAEVSARACLTAVIKGRGGDWKQKPYGVSAGRVRAVAATDASDADDAVTHWLGLEPRAPDVASVAKELLPALTPEVKAALASWSESSTKSQRTSLAKSLVQEPKDASRWLEVLSNESLNESGIVDLLKAEILDGGSAEARATAAREARALHVQTRSAAQTLAGAVPQLLRKSGRAKADIGVAALVAAALPETQIKAEAWGETFKKRCDERKYRFSSEEVDALRAAGISLPKEGLGKRLAKKLLG